MSGSSAGGDRSSTEVDAGLVAGHMARTRHLLALVIGFAVAVGAIAFGLGGTAVGRTCLAFGLLAIGGATLWLRWLTALPARMAGVAGVAAWVLLAIGIGGVATYFGVLSGAAAASAIAIMFVTMAHDTRIGLWTTLASLGVTATTGALIIGGAIADPGLIRIDHLPRGHQLALLVAELAVLATAYVVARGSRLATQATLGELDRSIRAAARREALLDDARAELARVRRIGAPGRFTDQVLGSYRLGVLIGAGAMGEVYEAVRVDSGEPAAIKLIRREALGDGKAVARFQREARLLASLRAPHVVRVLEVGTEDAPLPYIAMQRLRGRDLSAMLGDGIGFHPARLVTMLGQVARGLDAAHAAGVVHRDLKPHNLFCSQGAAGEDLWTVIDFGVARGRDDETGALTAGRVVGTPAYMAPEQAAHGHTDPASDRYALAVIGFRVLTGELPHRRDGEVAALLRRIAYEPPRLPTEVDPRLPDELDAVFAIALAREPDQRFASCAELATAVDAAVDGRLPTALAARGLARLHQLHDERRRVRRRGR